MSQALPGPARLLYLAVQSTLLTNERAASTLTTMNIPRAQLDADF